MPETKDIEAAAPRMFEALKKWACPGCGGSGHYKYRGKSTQCWVLEGKERAEDGSKLWWSDPEQAWVPRERATVFTQEDAPERLHDRIRKEAKKWHPFQGSHDLRPCSKCGGTKLHPIAYAAIKELIHES